MRCVLIGNYGIANVGDEALKDYFLQAFSEVEWLVLSAHPRQPTELPRLPGGIRSFFSFQWLKTLKALHSCDAVVFGGGSLFTDVESPYACLLWMIHAAVARFCKVPVYLAFQGMGPYKTRLGEWCARWVARRAAFVSVRDQASYRRMQNWELGIKVVQTFDPVFSLMEKIKSDISAQNLFVVIPRKNSGSTLQRRAEELIISLPNVERVHILLMQPDAPEEQAFAERLHSVMPMPSTVVAVRTVQELLTHVAGASFVLSHRFHGALAALAAGVPVEVLPQGEGDKLWELKRFTGEYPEPTQKLSVLVQQGEDALRRALILGK